MIKTSEDSVFGVLKLGVVLALYAAVSCTVLALVNTVTLPKIQQNQAIKINNAMNSFFSQEGLTFTEVTDFEPRLYGSAKIESLIITKKGEEILGGAAQVSGPTYDQATILVGMATDGTVLGVNFLKITDSPGFGLKANDPTFKLPNGKTFYGQFEGKNAHDGFVTGKTFDAISGATITSDGIAGLLTAGTFALEHYFELNNAGGNNE